jgi:hypothetical protein
MNESSREERTQEEEILGVSSLKFKDSEPIILLSLDGSHCHKILGDFASGPRIYIFVVSGHPNDKSHHNMTGLLFWCIHTF